MRVSPATPHELNSTKRILLCAESIFQRKIDSLALFFVFYAELPFFLVT